MLNDKRISVLDMTSQAAFDFFMKHESYFNGDLPSYFQFDLLLQKIVAELDSKLVSEILESRTISDSSGVNHTIYANKDGKLSWRPLELIHPVLYTSLVKEITKEANWLKIQNRFKEFQSNVCIECLSVPVQSLGRNKDRGEQVNLWWQGVELKTLELSLEYKYLFEADIADCYSSIYTHSIAWAIETKDQAKKNRRDVKLIGNAIDKSIQKMNEGQTNGIPQGSVLMDFVAEIVLGYVDLMLSERILESPNIESDYKIIRYRDDYRIFVNHPESGEFILKTLSEVLKEVGLRLNTSKTNFTNDVINGAIKKDKIAWLINGTFNPNVLKQALLIKQHSLMHVNSGSLSIALGKFYERLLKLKPQYIDITTISVISVMTDIAYRNPRTYAVCFAILSQLIGFVEDDEKKKTIVKKIHNKFQNLPNIGYMEIWLQRAFKGIDTDIKYIEPLCRYANDNSIEIWNSKWIKNNKLKNIMESNLIFNNAEYLDLSLIISSMEFSIFSDGYTVSNPEDFSVLNDSE